ncbi:MAG: sugar ABC transporter permease [Clostridia bacterium]|nr:sugar ABC transporter permease [Clostridia bacterium]
MESTIYRKKKPLLLFLVPTFLFMAVFLYYPFLMNVIGSFQQIPGIGLPAKGMQTPFFANYVKLFTDEAMLTAIKNTAVVMVCTVVFQVGIALVLALLVDNIHRGARFFRTVYFFPIVISAAALGLLFNIIFLYDKGLVNQLLDFAGHTGELIDWKGKGLALLTMILPVMWQYVGFYFVILVTGLNNIDPELYEAAAIDGATGIQRVLRITLPLLKGVISTCVVLAITGALKVFDLPWTMFPNGMPEGSTWLTGTYMYYQTIVLRDADYGSAIAVFIVVLGIAVSLVVNKIFKTEH